jgi:hypothetical protein
LSQSKVMTISIGCCSVIGFGKPLSLCNDLMLMALVSSCFRCRHRAIQERLAPRSISGSGAAWYCLAGIECGMRRGDRRWPFVLPAQGELSDGQASQLVGHSARADNWLEQRRLQVHQPYSQSPHASCVLVSFSWCKHMLITRRAVTVQNGAYLSDQSSSLLTPIVLGLLTALFVIADLILFLVFNSPTRCASMCDHQFPDCF